MDAALREAVSAAITQAAGSPFAEFTASPTGGGCINQTYRVQQGKRSYFLKANARALRPMFKAERDALQVLSAAEALRVPLPLAVGDCGEQTFLILEYLHLGHGNESSWAAMGEKLAALHRHTSPDGQYGWAHDNFIGSTPQPNAWHGAWVNFWREERLGYQLRLAAEDGHRFQQVDRLMENLETFFEGVEPSPSLLHGDLWGGNMAFTDSGEPVIYDPASYYGDREADLAMTRLFGSCPPVFYETYAAAYPLAPGHERRRDLYNLYHILNHTHLFGGHYAAQAQGLIYALAREI